MSNDEPTFEQGISDQLTAIGRPFESMTRNSANRPIAPLAQQLLRCVFIILADKDQHPGVLNPMPVAVPIKAAFAELGFLFG